MNRKAKEWLSVWAALAAGLLASYLSYELYALVPSMTRVAHPILFSLAGDGINRVMHGSCGRLRVRQLPGRRDRRDHLAPGRTIAVCAILRVNWDNLR